MRGAGTVLAALVATSGALLGGCEDTIDLTGDMDSCLAVEFQAVNLETAAFEDTTIDWSGLTVDLFGRPVDPKTDVDSVFALKYLYLTFEDFLFEMSCGEVTQADVCWGDGYLPQGDETSALFSEFDQYDLPLDVGTQFGDGTFGFMAKNDDVEEMLALAFVTPTAGAQVETIRLGEETASLVVHEEGGDEPVPRVDGHVLWLDWSDWAASGGGGDCGVCPGDGDSGDPPDVELIRLARFDPSVDRPELDMLAFEARGADVVYQAEVEDDEVLHELTALETEDGDRFDGFDDQGVWMLGLLGDYGYHWTPYFLGRVGD